MKSSSALWIFVCVAVVAIAPRFAVHNAIAVLWVEVAALTALMIAIGVSVTHRYWGILINERNVMSLSRFQAVLWTVLILADYATILLGRAWQGMSLVDGKDLLRPDLLMLMGISYGSAVGTSIVNANKAGKPTPVTAVADAQANLNDTNGSFTAAQGVMYKNKDLSDANVGDLFQGDELADAHTTDLSKVQMFFFTIVSAVIFLGTADAMFTNMKSMGDVLIPQLPENLIALMGISHTAYLGNKAVTRTQSRPSVEAQAQVAPTPQPSVVTTTGQAVAPAIQQ
jgi:hypothetical protein